MRDGASRRTSRHSLLKNCSQGLMSKKGDEPRKNRSKEPRQEREESWRRDRERAPIRVRDGRGMRQRRAYSGSERYSSYRGGVRCL